jgi:maltose phosphorylase
MRIAMSYKRLFEFDDWKIIEAELHRDDMRLAESIMSIGNGYMGMRGNFEERYSGDTHQGTYIAGVWFPDKTRVGWWKNGYPEYFGKVINAVRITGIDVILDGEPVDLFTDDVSDYRRELDMRDGVLRRTFVVRKKNRKTRIEAVRFFSIEYPEIAAVSYMVTPLDYSGHVELVPALDGNVHNQDANFDEFFWTEIDRGAEESSGYLVMKTKENPFGVLRFTVAAAMDIESVGLSFSAYTNRPAYVENKFICECDVGMTVGIRKFIAVTTSRDYEEKCLAERARAIARGAREFGFDSLLGAHAKLWHARWDKADIEIIGDVEAQQGIRFNLFQLFSTYYGEDARLNIGPKGFTGEKYGGATYWDTEAFVLPMYLAVSDSSVARNLLLYRYHQLDGARHNARQLGCAGALFPMVTFTGVECHNEWEITFEEIHRNGAVAHAVFDYVNYTGDNDYLRDYGIDVLAGIAGFWADRVHFSERAKRYMIHGVTGPNEYENNVNNNWYTNTLAAWCLEYACEVIHWLEEHGHSSRVESLGITRDDVEKWKDIAARMYYPYDEALGIFVQHDTFLDKEIVPASSLKSEDRPLNQNWSWDRILRSPFIKQADVLQGIYLFGDRFAEDVKQRNFDFYEPLTVHESSLSPCVHAVLAAELRKEEKAIEMYRRTSRLDLDNYNNDTEDGLHITSMAGSWIAIVQGFAGMRTFRGELSFSPFLPPGWKGYSFKINFRLRLIKISIDRESVSITLETGEGVGISIYDRHIFLTDEARISLSEFSAVGHSL